MKQGLREYLQPALRGEQFGNEQAVEAMNAKIARRISERKRQEITDRLSSRKAMFLGKRNLRDKNQATEAILKEDQKRETFLTFKATQIEGYFGKKYDDPIYQFLTEEIISLLFKELFGFSSVNEVTLEYSELLPNQNNQVATFEELFLLLSRKTGVLTEAMDTSTGNQERIWGGFNARADLAMLIQAANYFKVSIGSVTQGNVDELIDAGIIHPEQVFLETAKRLAKVIVMKSITYHSDAAKRLWPNFTIPLIRVTTNNGQLLGKISLCLAQKDVCHRTNQSDYEPSPILQRVVVGLNITLEKSKVPKQFVIRRLMELASLSPKQLEDRKSLTPKQIYYAK